KTKAKLTAEVLQKADLSKGRAIFTRTCANCHTLFDAGGKIGPDLTGSQRSNLDYVLSNIIDPSAVVAKDYQVTLIETKDGRVLNGIIKQENAAGVTLQTATETLVIPKGDIDTREIKPISLMPDGLLNNMNAEEVRDLIAYLASSKQVHQR